MKILVINGPNMKMLGMREPNVYGREDYASLCAFVERAAIELGCEVEIFQSNHEGAIVDQIQAIGLLAAHAAEHGSSSKFGIIINAAGYTHTSVAILDALRAVPVKAVEVHLTEPLDREEYRHKSYVGEACVARFAGMGFEGYRKAMEYLVENV